MVRKHYGYRRILALALAMAIATGNSMNVYAAELADPQTVAEQSGSDSVTGSGTDGTGNGTYTPDGDEEEKTETSAGGSGTSGTPDSGTSETPDSGGTEDAEETGGDAPAATPEEDGVTEDGANADWTNADPGQTDSDENDPEESGAVDTETEEPAETAYDEDGNLYTLTDETITIDGEEIPLYSCEFEAESGEEAHGEASYKAAVYQSAQEAESAGTYYWSYYNQIDNLSRQFYDALAEDYDSFKDADYTLEVSVDPSWTVGECYESVATAIAAFHYDRPEVFWLYANAFQWGATGRGYDLDGDGSIDELIELTIMIGKGSEYDTILTPIYGGDWNAVEADRTEMESHIAEILSEAETKNNLYEKLAVINDKITYLNYYNRYVAYGVSTSADLSKAYISASALTQQDWLTSADDYGDPESPVCEAYARSFKLICDRLGIPCIVVVGNSHMWNYVQDTSDGTWYAVDCTWDDPVRNDEYLIKETPETYIHRYLLVGSGTEVSGKTFGSEHPANGAFWVGGTSFETPVLSEDAYEIPEEEEPVEDGTEDQKDTVTVSFVTGTELTIESQTVEVSALLEKPEISRQGYTLVGWYTSVQQQDADTEWDFDEDKAESDMTLYALWQAEQYTVTLDANGGTADTASRTVVYDSVYGKLPEPVREGYEFTGWYTEAEEGELIAEDTVVAIDRDHTLYAHWDVITYRVTFKLGGGSFPITDSVVFEIPWNQSVAESITLPEDPVRTKYEFEGWYTAADGGEVFDFTAAVTEDISVYAHWAAMYQAEAPTANVIGSGASASPEDGKLVVAEEDFITLKSATLNAKIYYTTDGSEPDRNSSVYTDEIPIENIVEKLKRENSDEDAVYPIEITIKAFAVKDQYADSQVAVFTYYVEEDADWGDVDQGDLIQYLERKNITYDAESLGPADIPDFMWIAGVEDMEYTGSSITFSLRVYDHKTLLTEKTDYTVAYKNNKTVNDASVVSKAPTVTVTGKGNYTGKLEETFRILPVDISGEEFDAADILLAWNNKVQKQAPVLYRGGTKLKNGTDYTVSYLDTAEDAYKAVGVYEITITGKGNYTGTRTVTETITNKTLVSKLSVAAIPSQQYTGTAIEPALTVKSGSTVLKGVQESEWEGMTEEAQEEVDYTYQYMDNVAVGTASVIITGRNDYIGTRTVTFKITGIALSSAKISGFVSSYIYTGLPITQEDVSLTITTGKGASAVTTTLQEDKDYSVSYTKNEGAGTATVVYTGMGGYTGTLKKTFKITAYDLNKDADNRITVKYDTSVVYAKGGAKPVPTVTFVQGDGGEYKLTEGVDYTLSYTNNTAVNDGSNAKKLPTIVIKGKGNFTGTRKQDTFTIRSQDLSKLTLTAPDKVYANKKNNYPATPVITDLDGKTLKAGTDYEKTLQYYYEEDTELADGTLHTAGEEVSSADVIPAGTTLRVEATGKGYYTGTISGVYRVVSGDISKATVKVNSQYYTGKEVRPGKSQISVTLSGKLLSDQDYEITGYTNNINKGTAKVTIRGIGDYGGTKTVNFTIAVKSMYYIVSFNGNQATSGSMKTMQLAAGKEYTLTANAFKRTNYTFTGWNTRADGSGISYDDKDIITNAQDQSGITLILYAQWEPAEYTITYHLSGGPGNGQNTKTTYTPEDDAFTIYAPEQEDWPVGYQFGGWYTENTYQNKISIVKKGTSGNLDLYAKWIPYTYTVSFDGNGATGGSVEEEAFSYGVAKALNANKYKRTGYVFLGWALSAEAEEPDYIDKESVCDLISRRNNVTGTLTLYAVWQNQFRIEYVLNGGELDPSTANYAESYTYGVKQNLPTPVREGYAFAGWYKDAAFKTKAASVTASMSGDLTLYAKWTALSYTVSFNGNGQDSGSMAKMSLSSGTAQNLRKNAFIRKGYAFVGWSTSKDGAVEYADEEIIDILPSKKGETVTLYAQWKPTTYSVTYVTNGGTLTSSYKNYVDTYEYNHDGGYALPTPTRTGFTFAGWYLESDFKTKVASIAKTSYGDLTLYAKWSASCLVIYNANAGDATGTMAQQTLPYEIATALRSNTFKREGYVFMGWATAPDGDVVYTNAQKVQYPSEDDMTYIGAEWWSMTLYAVWKDQFTITWHANNGEEDATEIYAYGVGKTADTFPTPERDGYTFAGWYQDEAFKKKVTSLSKTDSGDIDLYAKWTGQSYQVTFAADAPEGKTASGKMSAQKLTYGTEKALTKNAFKVTGYTFLGWSTTPLSEASEEEKETPALRVEYENAEKIKGPELYGDVTLYAVWEKDVYTIVYYNMEGIENPNPDTYTVDDTVVLQEPERMGDTFLGWYTDAACKKKAADIKAGTTGNKTYYAKWSQVHYTLRYVLNGGVLNEGPVGYVNSYNSSTDTGYRLPTASREGYLFDGWYKEASFKTKVGPIIASPYVDMTLYAKWTKIPSATSFVLDTHKIEQNEGTTYQLEVTEIYPAGATDVFIWWESSNPEIASVDEKGLVSLNKAGMAVVTAYSEDRKFSDQCLVCVYEEADEDELSKGYVTPQMFRQVDDVDDTAAFNRAIQTFRGNWETLYVPAGTYYIDAEVGIRLASYMKLVMSPDAVLKAVGNSSEHSNVILIKEVTQIEISGGQIVGERYEHGGSTGEWGHGIGIYDSSVITINDVDISACWGDGIYLGTNRVDANTNKEAGCGVIKITGCNLYDNRRNNLSIVCADYVTIDSCTFKNANGTAPEYGIDIETNFPDNPCEHITISDSTFIGNGQASIGIVTAANDVRIEGCKLYGHFINYAGTNVVLSNSTIYGEADARIGILLEDGSQINDGTEAEDELAAAFYADRLAGEESAYTLIEYGVDDANQMSWSVVDVAGDNGDSVGEALHLERQSAGTHDAGYYIDLSELTLDGSSTLKKDSAYRFEYTVKGSGQWGIRTDQTGWYPIVPLEDQNGTGIVTYTANAGSSCRLILYAVDKTDGMWLEVESVKIYEVK